MNNFVVRPLALSQLRATYPLIREAAPALDFATWSRFARRIADPRRAARSEIMVAQRNGSPYPSGLFTYRKEFDMTFGTVLVADHIVAVDILAHEPIVSALVAAMEELAERLDCHAIRSILHGPSAELAPALVSAGHRENGTMLLKSRNADIAATPASTDEAPVPARNAS